VSLLQWPGVPLATRLCAVVAALQALSGLGSLDALTVAWAFGDAENQLTKTEAARGAESNGMGRDPGPSQPSSVFAGDADHGADMPRDGLLGPVLARIGVWNAMRGVPARYRRALDRMRDGLRLPADSGAPLDRQTGEAYAHALAAHVRPYLSTRPRLLENALVNWVHHSTFPYHPDRTFHEDGVILACRHATLVLHLAGAAAAEDGLTDALAIETIQAFDKYADSPDYWDRMLAQLRTATPLASDL